MEVLHERARPILTSWISRVVPVLDRNSLDDVWSSGLLKLWESRKSFEAGAKLGPWFKAILRHTAFDLLREERRAQLRVRNSLVSFVRSSDSTGIDDPKQARVRRALEELTESDQAILRAFARDGAEGNWAKKLARELGVSSGSLRIRKLRLLKTLKSKIEQQDRDPHE